MENMRRNMANKLIRIQNKNDTTGQRLYPRPLRPKVSRSGTGRPSITFEGQHMDTLFVNAGQFGYLHLDIHATISLENYVTDTGHFHISVYDVKGGKKFAKRKLLTFIFTIRSLYPIEITGFERLAGTFHFRWGKDRGPV